MFISSLIPSDSYRTVPIDSLDITAISLERLRTPLTIYSIYNPPNSDDSINALHRFIASSNASERLLITGDFNKHRSLWSGPLAPPHRSQQSDCDAILYFAADNSLQQCLQPGTLTF